MHPVIKMKQHIYNNKFVLKPYIRQCLFLINPEVI